MVPMDGVHEDHMNVDVQVFMDERARLGRGSHGSTCTRFPSMEYERSKDDALQEEKKKKKTHRQKEARRTCL